jgi:hypothetical protein
LKITTSKFNVARAVHLADARRDMRQKHEDWMDWIHIDARLGDPQFAGGNVAQKASLPPLERVINKSLVGCARGLRRIHDSAIKLQ